MQCGALSAWPCTLTRTGDRWAKMDTMEFTMGKAQQGPGGRHVYKLTHEDEVEGKPAVMLTLYARTKAVGTADESNVFDSPDDYDIYDDVSKKRKNTSSFIYFIAFFTTT